MQKHQDKHNGEIAAECAICYEEFLLGTNMTECHKCVYKYHTNCLRKWFRSVKKNECPICKSHIKMDFAFSKINSIIEYVKKHIDFMAPLMVLYFFYMLLSNFWRYCMFWILSNFESMQHMMDSYFYMFIEYTFQVLVVARIITYTIIHCILYHDNIVYDPMNNEVFLQDNIYSFFNTEKLITSFQVMISIFYMSERLFFRIVERAIL